MKTVKTVKISALSWYDIPWAQAAVDGLDVRQWIQGGDGRPAEATVTGASLLRQGVWELEIYVRAGVRRYRISDPS